MTHDHKTFNKTSPEDPQAGTVRQQHTAKPVSTLELFFDLVFVFTLTQLTHLLSGELNPTGLIHVLLIFGVSWWMYGGYAWLTNHLSLDRLVHRLLLLLGMGAFLVMALAIPNAFRADAIIFGLAYLAVVCMHAFLFLQATKAITRIALFNIISALLVIAAAFPDDKILIYGAWSLAMILQLITPYLAGLNGFQVHSGHFVERHGLLMIIALGESVVAVGIGAAALPLDQGLIAAAVLGLALVSCLWWAYFVDSSEKAESALKDAAPDQRSKLALNSFFYAHIPMLLGVVFIAVGLESAIEHAFEPLGLREAAAISGGVSLFLAGNVIFRRILGIGSGMIRAVIAVVALCTIPLSVLSASIQLVSLVLIFVIGFLIEARQFQ